MKPLIVLVISFVVFLLIGRLGVGPLRDWAGALRWALAMMFLFAASAHFSSMRSDLVRMVPPVFPVPDLLVTLTGLLEIVGAVGLVIPRVAPVAAGCLALLLLAMFPANIYAAKHGIMLGGAPATAIGLRAAIQVVFIGALLVAGFVSRWRS
jgi:uncharacterized membrane protein